MTTNAVSTEIKEYYVFKEKTQSTPLNSRNFNLNITNLHYWFTFRFRKIHVLSAPMSILK